MKKIFLTTLSTLLLSGGLFAQCETWNGSPRLSEAEEAHTIYRGMVKNENYDEAFSFWKKAYEIAPAADGKRDFHYRDGIKIYLHKLKNTTDEAKKKEYVAEINKLYDQMASCYTNKVIELKDCDENCYKATIGNVYASQAYDMFYTMRAPYSTNLDVAEKALQTAGLKADYSVFEPALTIAAYQFKNGKIDAERVRNIYKMVEESAAHNIANDKEYGEYYDAASKRAFAAVSDIESDIFDCSYFMKKLKPKYEENSTDFEVLKYVYNTLRNNGCEESDEFLVEVKTQYEKLAAEYNASVLAELEAANPALAANRLYKEENYEGAIQKYQEAIDMSTDNIEIAKHYYSIASIQFRKLDRYSDARESARKSFSANPSDGKPLMLIGDMYATSARNCGDDWNQRLAILAAIDKYAEAKRADSSLSDDANSRISKYAGAKPSKDEAFMRGHKSGQSTRVGCWIGESVTLRF